MFTKEYTTSIALVARNFPVDDEGEIQEEGFSIFEAERVNFTFEFTGHIETDRVSNEFEDKIESWPETLTCKVTSDALVEGIFQPAYLNRLIEQLKEVPERQFHKYIEEETD